MIAVEPWQLSAEGLVAAIRGGEVSAAEALESVLARADTVAPALNPFAVRLDDRAREAAAGVDAAIRRRRCRPARRFTGDNQGLAMAGRGAEPGGLAAARGLRADRDLRDGAAADRRRRRDLRDHDDAGVLPDRRHRVEAARADAQPLGPWPDARRVVGRRGSCACSGRRAARAGWRRRRVDPHPRRLLRTGRVQAELRRRPPGALYARLALAGLTGSAGALRRRRAADAAGDRGPRPPRPQLDPPAGARRAGARPDGRAAGRLRDARVRAGRRRRAGRVPGGRCSDRGGRGDDRSR